jgi:rubrerythrin
MFSMRDILDIAIKIEENGERTYRRAAQEVTDPRLASLLHYLADQEAEHAAWFAGGLDCVPEMTMDDDSALATMGRDMLRNVIGDQSFSLSEVDFSKMDSVIDVLDAAFDLENDTAAFYEMLASFIDEQKTLECLRKIIHEEMRHAKALAEYVSTGAVSAIEEIAP